MIRARLSTFDASMIVVSLVVGIGIFRTPSIVAAGTGTAGRFFLAWGIGGAISALGALAFAEIGSRLAAPGGMYRVVAECYHPGLGFMLNWAGVLMQGAGATGVAFIAAEHLVPLLLPDAWQGPQAVPTTAVVLLLGLLLVNHLGIRAGANTQNVLTLLKIAMIVLLAATALAGSGRAETAPPLPASTGAFLGALVAVLYTYGGYHNTINMGGDVGEARRKLPLAILCGVGIVVALYLTMNAGYLAALGIGGIATSKLVAAELARVRFGESGRAVVSVAIALSALGFLNATILHVPRSYLAMAQDRLLPRFFLRVNPRTEAQGPGLAFLGATMILPALMLGSFEKLLGYVIFTDALSLAVVASTIFALRRRGSGGDGAFRMPGYPWAPALYGISLVAIAGYLVMTATGPALAGAAVFASGWPLYLGMRRLASYQL